MSKSDDNVLCLAIRKKNGDVEVNDIKLTDIKCIIRVNENTFYIQTTEEYLGPLKKIVFNEEDIQGLIKCGVKIL